MSARKNDDFFIGWAPPSSVNRRGVLIAGLGLGAAGAGAASLLARDGARPGPGAWDQGDVRTWTGDLVRAPYPALRLQGADGAPQTAFLGTTGKTSVAPRLREDIAGSVTVRASAIRRGRHLMLAVIDGDDWIAPQGAATAAPGWREEDQGPATLIGEILDAKCWFGAMRPGWGKTHKSCAALCAQGGLPLAFCTAGACGDGVSALLFVDERGHAHDASVIPLVADPVMVAGRLVRVGDVVQLRASLGAITRL